MSQSILIEDIAAEMQFQKRSQTPKKNQTDVNL